MGFDQIFEKGMTKMPACQKLASKSSLGVRYWHFNAPSQFQMFGTKVKLTGFVYSHHSIKVPIAHPEIATRC